MVSFSDVCQPLSHPSKAIHQNQSTLFWEWFLTHSFLVHLYLNSQQAFWTHGWTSIYSYEYKLQAIWFSNSPPEYNYIFPLSPSSTNLIWSSLVFHHRSLCHSWSFAGGQSVLGCILRRLPCVICVIPWTFPDEPGVWLLSLSFREGIWPLGPYRLLPTSYF